jgi:hypothetical protein
MKTYMVAISLLLALGGGCGGDDDGGGGDDPDAGGGGGEVDAGPGVEMTFRTRVGGLAGNVSFFGFQDGDGPWTEVDGLGGRYEVARHADRFGLVWVCRMDIGESSYHLVSVTYATADDTLPEVIRCEAPAFIEEEGSVSGLTDGQSVLIDLRGGAGQADDNNTDFTTIPMPPGPNDVVAVRRESSAIVDLIIQRGLDLPDGGINLAFGGTTITPEALGGGNPDGVSSGILTALGASADIALDDASIWRLPDGALHEGDYHQYSRSDAETGGHVYYTEAGDPVDLTPPASAATATIEVVESGDNPRFSVDMDVTGDVTFWRLRLEQVDDGSVRNWLVTASDAWLDGATAFETPGFADVDGWDSDWTVAAGVEATMFVSPFWTNRGLAPLMDAPYYGTSAPTDDYEGLEVLRYSGESVGILP